MIAGTMRIYEQQKLGLSAYYDKRRVLPDGIHTEPLEYPIPIPYPGAPQAAKAAEMDAGADELLAPQAAETAEMDAYVDELLAPQAAEAAEMDAYVDELLAAL